MKEITVTIGFTRDIDIGQAKTLVELLDIEMGHILNQKQEKWVTKKNQGNGWGMGRSLVTDVKLKKE